MKRIPKILSYNFSSVPQLKGEAHSHTIKGKSRKAKGSSQPPVSMPVQSAGFAKEVHYGSHRSIERQIGAEMRRLGL